MDQEQAIRAVQEVTSNAVTARGPDVITVSFPSFFGKVPTLTLRRGQRSKTVDWPKNAAYNRTHGVDLDRCISVTEYWR